MRRVLDFMIENARTEVKHRYDRLKRQLLPPNLEDDYLLRSSWR